MFRRRRSPRDFSDELRAHLALEIDRLRAEGLSEREAYRAARRNLGNLVSSEERFYESSRWMWLDHLRQDIRYSLRRLKKTPAFTLTAVLTLALGIGVTTAVFTLVHAVLLQSLPVAKPGELYRVGNQTRCCVWGGYTQEGEFSLVSYELYQHLRDNAPGFAQLAGFSANVDMTTLRRQGSVSAADVASSEFVSGNYFEMFGVRPFAGRMLTALDDRRGAAPVAVMSYATWKKKYGLDASVVGSAFEVDGKPFTVAGIATPGFFGDALRTRPPDLWIPIADEPLLRGQGSLLDVPNAHWLDMIGRIGEGANPAAVESRLKVALRQWLESHAADAGPTERSQIPRQSIHLAPGGDGITGLREQYEHGLDLLMLVSAVVLLIVCANMANLMLVRGMERRQEVSLSMALGAGGARVVGQALTESIVLALIGGAAGIGVAIAGTHALLAFAFGREGPGAISANPSLGVLLFALGVSIATGILFGVVPAFMTSRTDAAEALRGANRSTREFSSVPRKALVVFQAALSLVLLSGAGLLTETLRNLENQDYGFQKEGRVVARIDPLLAGYKPAQLEPLYRELQERLSRIPGVQKVSIAMYSPMSSNDWAEGVFIEGQAPPAPGDYSNGASWDRVGPGYFENLGIRITRGRPITAQDTAGSRHVAVVNEAFVRRFLKNQNPIGKHFGKNGQSYAGDYEIVGVAADARYISWDLDKPVRPMFFLPPSQASTYSDPNDIGIETRSHYLQELQLRVGPGAQLLEPQVRRALGEINPNLVLLRFLSLSDQVSANFTQPRLIARLTSMFGMLALALASLGLYGVTAYSVGRRTREIGVRMALGANRRAVAYLVLRGAFLLIALGLMAGVPLTLAIGRILSSQLYGVAASDPFVLGGAAGVLAFCALAAALIPAWRAASIAPMEALHAE